jgi:hypothetical protein
MTWPICPVLQARLLPILEGLLIAVISVAVFSIEGRSELLCNLGNFQDDSRDLSRSGNRDVGSEVICGEPASGYCVHGLAGKGQGRRLLLR